MLVQSQHYPVPNKTIVMLKEQLETKINECQGELITEMTVHAQRAKDKSSTRSSKVRSIFA